MRRDWLIDSPFIFYGKLDNMVRQECFLIVLHRWILFHVGWSRQMHERKWPDPTTIFFASSPVGERERWVLLSTSFISHMQPPPRGLVVALSFSSHFSLSPQHTYIHTHTRFGWFNYTVFSSSNLQLLLQHQVNERFRVSILWVLRSVVDVSTPRSYIYIW